mgnify:CR=1 FL=1
MQLFDVGDEILEWKCFNSAHGLSLASEQDIQFTFLIRVANTGAQTATGRL